MIDRTSQNNPSPNPSKPPRKQQQATGARHRRPPQHQQQQRPQRPAFRQKVSSANQVAICTTTSAGVGRRTLRELMHPITTNDGGQEAYTVPIFQRRYCWNTPQWDMLWHDVLQRNSIKHSLGRLTCTNVNTTAAASDVDAPRKTQRSIIIDGQQRFTTIALFLSAIRDALLALQDYESSRQGDALLQTIHEMLFLDPNAMQDWISDRTTNTTLAEGLELDFCRLVPTFCDRSAYMAAILPPHAPQVQRFFKEAFNPRWHRPLLAKQHLASKVASLLESTSSRSPLQSLEKLTSRLLDGIDMLYFPIDVHKGYQDGTEDTQVIYERLAIRDATWCKPRRKWEGHSMDGTDMIRNLFLGSFSTSLQKTIFYETCWLPLERMFQTTLEATDDDDDDDDGEESLTVVLRAFLDAQQASLEASAASSSSRPRVIGGRIYRDFEAWMTRDFQHWQENSAVARRIKAFSTSSLAVNSYALAEEHTLDVGKRLVEFASRRIQSNGHTNTL